MGPPPHPGGPPPQKGAPPAPSHPPPRTRRPLAMTKSPPQADAADKVVKKDTEWRAQLTPEQYYVTRQHGTERAGTSPLNKEKRQGMFACVCCATPLFASDAKFDSGTGWPSFDKPAAAASVSKHEDRALFMRRTE